MVEHLKVGHAENGRCPITIRLNRRELSTSAEGVDNNLERGRIEPKSIDFREPLASAKGVLHLAHVALLERHLVVLTRLSDVIVDLGGRTVAAHLR